MLKYKQISFLSNVDYSIIDYANLNSFIFLNQKKLIYKKDYLKFLKKKNYEIPIFIRKDLKYFSYDKSSEFTINSQDIKKNIFSIQEKKNYIIADRFCEKGLIFNNKSTIKKKYKNIISKINKYNNSAKKKISVLNKKYPKLISFQTRNIPHLGHEQVIKHLIKKHDHVVINPVIGPKKKDDIRISALIECYNFLIKKHYKGKISLIPIIANMYYAGPKEALHHAIIRSRFGFKNFYVGRDHAGAAGYYNPFDAIKYAKLYGKKHAIKIMSTKGGVFCPSCNNYLIRGDCRHKVLDISGTEFRKHLKEKKIFKHAKKDLQEFIFKKLKNLFY